MIITMISTPSISLYRMRTPPDEKMRPGNGQAVIDPEQVTAQDTGDRNQLLCRQCLFAITNAANRIAVDGAHNHAFANPHGIVFEIGCFRTAAGCGTAGQPTDEFSWFSGYVWQVAICSSCLLHVGWRFTGTNREPFYGLIHDRLIESTAASGT